MNVSCFLLGPVRRAARTALPLAISILCAANATNAATLTLTVDTLALGQTYLPDGFTPNQGVRDQSYPTQDSTVSPALSTSAAAAESGDLGTASGYSFAYANATRGTLGLSSTVAMTGYATGSANGSAILEELYTVEGSGTLTVFMWVDGFWDTQPTGGISYDIFGGVCIYCYTNIVAADGFSLSYGANDPASGSTSVLVSASRDITTNFGPQTVDVGFSLYSNLFAPGTIDFSSTGKAWVTASNGLTISAADPNFLSDPAFLEISAVPLPAGIFLLGGGLLGLGLLGRRKTPAFA
ncbi:VPLPA-CTERM sorting domain-containing protein [Tropicibacter sp. S64]|uniref:VPLPA-CTERM sorting domain-containing protein n=1 Tax=Tropicibacter sp. S64 TaxID=3415122 RepID=UPI003C7EC3AA